VRKAPPVIAQWTGVTKRIIRAYNYHSASPKAPPSAGRARRGCGFDMFILAYAHPRRARRASSVGSHRDGENCRRAAAALQWGKLDASLWQRTREFYTAPGCRHPAPTPPRHASVTEGDVVEGAESASIRSTPRRDRPGLRMMSALPVQVVATHLDPWPRCTSRQKGNPRGMPSIA